MWARLTVVLEWYSGFILLFFFAINTYYLVLTVAGFWRTLRVFKEVQRPDQRRLLRSLLMLDYPPFEVILINDGSSDQILGRLVEAFGLRRSARGYERALPSQAIRDVYESTTHANLVVIDKENGGKADALNAGCRGRGPRHRDRPQSGGARPAFYSLLSGPKLGGD